MPLVERILPSARSIRADPLCAANTAAYDIPISSAVSRTEQPSTAIRQKACQVCGSTRCFTACWACSAWRSRSERRASGSSCSGPPIARRPARMPRRADRRENGRTRFSAYEAGQSPGNGRTAGASHETSCPDRIGTCGFDPPARSRFAGEGHRACCRPGHNPAPGTNQGIIGAEEIAPCGLIRPVGDPLQALSPVYGQQVTLTATVQPAAGASGTPTGSVTFYDGAADLGTASLVGGTATLPVANLPVGTDAITASYGGDSQFKTSLSSAVDVTVGKDGTSVSLTPSVNPAATGQEITFTAIVSPLAAGRGNRDGSVTFKDGTTRLGTAALSGGTATYSIDTLPLGNTFDHGRLQRRSRLPRGHLGPAERNDPDSNVDLPHHDDSGQFGEIRERRSTGHADRDGQDDRTHRRNAHRIGHVHGRHDQHGHIPFGKGKIKLTTSGLPLGTDAIQVIYSGDNSFNGGKSPILVETIQNPPKKRRRLRS